MAGAPEPRFPPNPLEFALLAQTSDLEVILETVSAVREMLLGQVALLLSLGFLAPFRARQLSEEQNPALSEQHPSSCHILPFYHAC